MRGARAMAIMAGVLAGTTPPRHACAQGAWESKVSGSEAAPEELPDDRASSSVKKRDIDRRQPRSAPDALRYEPGVFVQQTAHGMGSAFIRGLTGQQTLMLFDGIRLNNSTYRSGPNQYFFTLDARTIRAIDVMRGGGSTLWGSDALGGVIDALPIEPTLVDSGLRGEARFMARMTTADSEAGGRFQLELSGATAGGTQIAFLGGIGARNVGLLTGPPVLNPNPNTAAGALPWVPRYKEYDASRVWADQPELRTMLGTGFHEVTGDARLVIQPNARHQLTLATYLYRQLDSPRTDQCPPPTAPTSQCFTYEQQFRTLAYAAWKGRLGRFADTGRITLSWQEQHEQRRLDLTPAKRVDRGVDDVETFGLAARFQTERLEAAPWLGLSVAYGADTYLDWLRSRLRHWYTDIPDGLPATPSNPTIDSRGQYLGGTYLYGGAYGQLVADVGSRLRVHGGVRASWISARAPSDPVSSSKAVRSDWYPVVGNASVEVRATDALRLFVNYDNSYRAPNLDDMTSRQQTGPGYQFENPDLRPERANTFEVGGRLRTRWVVADAWLFETLITDGILKVSKFTEECPLLHEVQRDGSVVDKLSPDCAGSWARFQLQNAPTYSELRGAEGGVKLFLPWHLSLRATISYVWSEGPRLGTTAKDVKKDAGKDVFGVLLGERIPLSRTPPLNGTAELYWQHPLGIWAGAALQWAAPQDRLSFSDYSDGRIPKYGTPGFAVVSLRGGYRFTNQVMASFVVENLLDSPYRFHGSSVNGAGRGLMLQLEMAPNF